MNPISTSVSTPTTISSHVLPVLIANAHTTSVIPPIHSHVLRGMPPGGGCGASGASASGAAAGGASFLGTLALVYTVRGAGSNAHGATEVARRARQHRNAAPTRRRLCTRYPLKSLALAL